MSTKRNDSLHRKDTKLLHRIDSMFRFQVDKNDTLEKIALHFNLTPSELIHLNKLNSRLVFPGQILYVPESILPNEILPSTNVRPKEADVFVSRADRRSSGGESSSPPFVTHSHHQQEVGPMVWSMSRHTAAKPGHAERLKSETSIESETSPRSIEERLKNQKEDNSKQVRQIQKSFSIDENRQLDEECLQRFLKINVQLVTDDHVRFFFV